MHTTNPDELARALRAARLVLRRAGAAQEGSGLTEREEALAITLERLVAAVDPNELPHYDA